MKTSEIRKMTPEEIRRVGLDALKSRLGVTGMIRFMHQFETGRGDYTAERRTWLDKVDFSAFDTRVLRRCKRK